MTLSPLPDRFAQLELSTGVPCIQLRAAYDIEQRPAGAWLHWAQSGYAVGERVQLTAAELRRLADECVAFAQWLEQQ